MTMIQTPPTRRPQVTHTTSAAGPHPSYGQITGGARGMTDSASGGITDRASGTMGSAFASSTGTASGSGVHSHSSLHTHSLGAHTHAAPAHSHSMLHNHSLNMHTHEIGDHRHHFSHTHTIWHQHRIDGHAHRLAPHAHRVNVPQHRHELALPAHTHEVALPAHLHEVVPGIFREGNPTGGAVLVGGAETARIGRDGSIDLTGHLLGADGRVPRGQWITVGVRPYDLAYVTIDLCVQGFVQSRGGGTY